MNIINICIGLACFIGLLLVIISAYFLNKEICRISKWAVKVGK